MTTELKVALGVGAWQSELFSNLRLKSISKGSGWRWRGRWSVCEGRNRTETKHPLSLVLSLGPDASKCKMSDYYTMLDTFITEGTLLFVIRNDWRTFCYLRLKGLLSIDMGCPRFQQILNFFFIIISCVFYISYLYVSFINRREKKIIKNIICVVISN